MERKGLCDEIFRQCFRRNIQVNKSFLEYYVKLLSLNCDHNLSEQNFVEMVIEKIKNQNNPQFVTLKMQWYFKEQVLSKESVTNKNRTELSTKLVVLEESIVKFHIKDQMDVGKIYKQIVYYITLLSGMGNPNDEGVYTEAYLALKSILNERELKDFTNLPKYQKFPQLLTFMKQVTGIRIFNRDCNRGGEGIVDLPGLVYKSMRVTKEKLRQSLWELMQKINMLTTGIDMCYKIKATDDDKKEMECNVPDNASPEDIEYAKGLLIAYRQYEIYLRQIMSKVENEESFNEFFVNLKKTLMAIHEICNVRVAISCALIFPLFEQLSDFWTLLQNEAIYLSIINVHIKNLEYYVNMLKYPQETVNILLSDSEMMTDAQRLQKHSGVKLQINNKDAYVIPIENIKNIDNYYIECLRCDVWKLINTDGGLLPGIPNMGVVVVLNSYKFTFAEPDSAAAFIIDIAGGIKQMIMMLKKRIELIEMFNGWKFMVPLQELFLSKSQDTQVTKSVGVQTEDVISAKWDKNYKWNVWDMKREALHLANISKKKTVSTETKVLDSKQNSLNQTSRNQEVQTYTSKKINFDNFL